MAAHFFVPLHLCLNLTRLLHDLLGNLRVVPEAGGLDLCVQTLDVFLAALDAERCGKLVQLRLQAVQLDLIFIKFNHHTLSIPAFSNFRHNFKHYNRNHGTCKEGKERLWRFFPSICRSALADVPIAVGENQIVHIALRRGRKNRFQHRFPPTIKALPFILCTKREIRTRQSQKTYCFMRLQASSTSVCGSARFSRMWHGPWNGRPSCQPMPTSQPRLGMSAMETPCACA